MICGQCGVNSSSTSTKQSGVPCSAIEMAGKMQWVCHRASECPNCRVYANLLSFKIQGAILRDRPDLECYMRKLQQKIQKIKDT